MQNDELSQYKNAINQAMEQFLVHLPDLFDLQLSHQSSTALKILQEYCSRPSKRIRGSLAAFSYDQAANTKYAEAGIQAGLALELVQNYLLIIDDVTDKSDYRRGELTVHKIYERPEMVPNSDKHLANMMAVNVGLLSQHLVNIVMAQIKEKPEHLNESLLLMHKNISATAFGQIDDMLQQIESKIDEADIFNKYQLKSSYYTFVNPLQVGLVLAGVNDKQKLNEVRQFGIAAGIAFQLHDDLLGVFGDSSLTGKSTDDDIKEGKYTLLVHHALSHASKHDSSLLRSWLGNQNLSKMESVQAKNLLSKYGSKEYVQQQSEKYSKEAIKQLQESTVWNAKAKRVLEELIEYVTKREV